MKLLRHRLAIRARYNSSVRAIPDIWSLLLAAATLGSCAQGTGKPRRILAAADLLGCWRIAALNGASPQTFTTFWDAGVRLDTVVGRKTQLWSPGLGEYDVRPLARIPDSLSWDTAYVLTTWRIAPPNSLYITRSMGLGGTALAFMVERDSLHGSIQGFSDVAEYNRTAIRRPLMGYRISCGP